MFKIIKEKIHFAKIAHMRKQAFKGKEKEKEEYRAYINQLCKIV